MSVASSRRSVRAHAIDKERRGTARFQAFAEVWADPGGTALAIPCKVVDISSAGAKIQEIEGALPDEFVLHSSNLKYRARVVWRRQTTIGVEFVGA